MWNLLLRTFTGALTVGNDRLSNLATAYVNNVTPLL